MALPPEFFQPTTVQNVARCARSPYWLMNSFISLADTLIESTIDSVIVQIGSQRIVLEAFCFALNLLVAPCAGYPDARKYRARC